MSEGEARRAIHVVEKNPYTPQPFVFTEAATCLRDAIRAAGYESEHLVNRVDPSAYSIVLGGTPAMVKELPGIDPLRCAIFNFEQLGSTSNLAGPEYRRWLAGWLVLDYHSSNIDFLKRENGARQLAFELPLVPSENLVTPPDQAKSVDVLFFGTMSERRAQVLRELEAMGLKVEVVAGAYGRELAPAVRRARLVLHIHYYERALFPVARFVQPVMMGVPIVCETSLFSEHGDWSHSGIVFADYAHLAETCRDLLGSPERMARRAEMARDFVRHIDFATPFEHVVRAFEALPIHANAVFIEQDVRAVGEGEERALTDEEIEAILAAEGASPPAADQPAPRLDVVRREPGQGHFGKWIAWLLVFFMVAGAIKSYF
jgi:hypothetical protein